MTKLAIRDADTRDLQNLADLTVMSGHGLAELLYEGLIPGRDLTAIIIERRLCNGASFAHLPNWRVACLDGAVLGAICTLPFAVYAGQLADPLIPAERMDTIRELIDLEAGLAGTYCVTNIAVRPEARGQRVGRALLADAEMRARAKGFDRIGLSTFGDDPVAMGFYRHEGFRVIDTAPMRPHPRLLATGRWAILDRAIDRPHRDERV